jgi:hypothetical protein
MVVSNWPWCICSMLGGYSDSAELVAATASLAATSAFLEARCRVTAGVRCCAVGGDGVVGGDVRVPGGPVSGHCRGPLLRCWRRRRRWRRRPRSGRPGVAEENEIISPGVVVDENPLYL